MISTLGAQVASSRSYEVKRGIEIFKIFGFNPLPISASVIFSCTLSNTSLPRIVTTLLGRGSTVSSRHDVQIDRSSRCGKSERKWRNEPASPLGRETDKDLTDGQDPPNASATSSFVAFPQRQYVSRNSSTRVKDLKCSAEGNLCDHWSQLLFIHNFLTYPDTPPAPGRVFLIQLLMSVVEPSSMVWNRCCRLLRAQLQATREQERRWGSLCPTELMLTQSIRSSMTSCGNVGCIGFATGG